MSERKVLVEVRDLAKLFPIRRGFFRRHAGDLHAVDGVSFDVRRGETLALVGESGSGKSTLGRLILRLIEPTSGTVRFDGTNLMELPREPLRKMRRRMQIIFQDPYSSLNPMMTVRTIVREPLTIHRIGARRERDERAMELLRMVGLKPELARRYPHELSGGERQRVGIARAIALEPEFLVADEPVTALDVSVQAQVINLLMEMQQRLRLTYLFIAHDLRLVRHICDRVAVMYRGRIVEMGSTDALFEAPAHPYTRALLSAIPALDPRAPRSRIVLDPKSFDRSAPLREVSSGHFAAL
jgi:oligopeptide transport system ATP-binding protein